MHRACSQLERGEFPWFLRSLCAMGMEGISPGQLSTRCVSSRVLQPFVMPGAAAGHHSSPFATGHWGHQCLHSYYKGIKTFFCFI